MSTKRRSSAPTRHPWGFTVGSVAAANPATWEAAVNLGASFGAGIVRKAFIDLMFSAASDGCRGGTAETIDFRTWGRN